MSAFNNWKEYVDHDNLAKDNSKDFKSIILKLHKKPEKINEDLLRVDKELLFYPDKDHPCSIYLKKDLERDRDYMIVSQEIWEYFEKKYGGTPIKRNFISNSSKQITLTDEFDNVFSST
jgi:ubiquitin carboxyl-terminal hydrolase 4/11/15